LAAASAGPVPLERWLAVAALLPALIFLAVVLAPPLNHDVAAILDFTQRWMAGEALYREILDVNPPLIFVLTRGVLALGGALGLAPITTVLTAVLTLCAASLALIHRLRRGLPEGPIEARCLTFALPLIMVAAGYDFAQREHLMIVLALPYLFLAVRRVDGLWTERWLVLTVALLAATGFVLKPHFLAVPALIEGYLLWRRGWRASLADPVPWTIAGVALAYLGAIVLFFPDYIEFLLPLAMAYYLPTTPLSEVIFNERMAPVLVVMLPAAVVALRGKRGLAPMLALTGIGALAAAIAQQRGWTYHVLPIRLMAGLLFVLLIARWLDYGLPAGRRWRVAPRVAVLATLALGLHNVNGSEAPWRELNFARSWTGVISDVLARVAPGGRVLVLSPDIDPVYPALNYANARSTLPTMNLWLFQAFYSRCLADGTRYRTPEAMGADERWFHDRVVRDFTTRPPEILMVARHIWIPHCGGQFSILEYFERHTGFAATFRRYRLVADFPSYRIFRRED